MAMMTLWFKSNLCFCTLVTLDSSFFLPWSSFVPHFLSDHVIHARLHIVWTRTKGIHSQWTLTETSVKLQQNGTTRAAECGQGCCRCDVNLCPVNVWAEPADYKQCWRTHWALTHSDIRLHTWPRAQLDQWRCLKGGNPCAFPYQQLLLFFVISVIFFLCSSHQPLYHELKRPATNIALRWPGTRAGHLQKHPCGFFVKCCFSLVLLLPTGCMPPPMQFGIEGPSKTLIMTGFPWAPSAAWGWP